MEEGHTRARERISTRLSGTSASAEGKTGYCMYNYAQARLKLVRLPEAAGRNFEQTGQLLFAQDDGPDRLVSVTLPAYGYALVTETQSGVSDVTGETVTVADDCLENQFLRLEFDLQSGTLRRAIDKTNGRDLLTANSHAFYFPQSSRQVCRQSRIRLQGPLRGSIAFNIELADDSGNRCTMETVVSLDANQAVATFATKVLEVPGLEGNQWSNHLGVQFQFPDAGTEILASHFNVLEPFFHNQIFSPNVLVTRSEAGDTVFLNEGNQFYVRDGQSLRHIMIMENEPLREFRYAVGAAKNNPIMQSLKWSQPCFVQKTETRNGLEHANQSLIDLGNENIELLSCRYDQGALLVRLANTAGVPVKAALSVFQPVTSASMTGLDGKPGRSLKVSDGRIKLNLRPWDIRQVRMTL